MGSDISKNTDVLNGPIPLSKGYNPTENPGIMPPSSISETPGERATNKTAPHSTAGPKPRVRNSGDAFR